MDDVTGEMMLMAERAFKERDLLRSVVYKMQMPGNEEKLPPAFLSADELAAYKRAIVESI